MNTSEWPPPVPDDVQWRQISMLQSRPVEPFRVREVRLWGRSVWIDEAGAVLCDCQRMVAIDELCAVGNGHSVSPVASRGGTWIGPVTHEEVAP